MVREDLISSAVSPVVPRCETTALIELQISCKLNIEQSGISMSS